MEAVYIAYATVAKIPVSEIVKTFREPLEFYIVNIEPDVVLFALINIY